MAIRTETAGATIRYTLDGSDPTAKSPMYTSPLAVAKTTTLKAVALKTGAKDSAVRTGKFAIEIPPDVVHPVQISPNAGDYSNDFWVELTSDTAGATLCYTTGGATPACDAQARCSGGSSTFPSSSIRIKTTDTTVRAIACKSGMATSGETLAKYTLTATKPVFDPSPENPDYSKPVTLSTTTDRGVIHYTTDGSTPDCSSTLAFKGSGTFPFFEGAKTVRALTCKDGYVSSDEVTASYLDTLCQGNVHVANAHDLQAISHCRQITGTLTIDAKDIVDLAPLRPLQKVSGDVDIHGATALTSLHGLEGLGEVGGSFRIRENTALERIDVLYSLRKIGGSFEIADAAKLQHIGGLGALTEIGGDFGIRRNASLTIFEGTPPLAKVGGTMVIADNAALLEVSGFSWLDDLGSLQVTGNKELASFYAGPDHVHGDVTFKGNPKLERLSMYTFTVDGTVTIGDVVTKSSINFSFLESAGAVILSDIRGSSVYLNFPWLSVVKGRFSILNTSGLEYFHQGLESVGSLEVRGNETLWHLQFERLGYHGAAVGEIHITDNPALTEIGTLQHVRQLPGDLEISRNPKLKNLLGTYRLQSVHNLTLEQNTSLLNGIYFDDLEHVTGNARFSGNDYWSSPGWKLTTIDGSLTIDEPRIISLQAFTYLQTVGGNLEIKNTEHLPSPYFMTQLTSVGGYLEISGNRKLESLEYFGLTKLLGTRLTIANNPALPACWANGLATKLHSNGFEGTHDIHGNTGTGACPP